MVKASKLSKGTRARKRTPAVKAALVADSLALARRDLQRAHRTQKEITILAKSLARRIRTADDSLVELGARLMDRASKIAKARGESTDGAHAAEAVGAAGLLSGI